MSQALTAKVQDRAGAHTEALRYTNSLERPTGRIGRASRKKTVVQSSICDLLAINLVAYFARITGAGGLFYM